MNQVQLVGRLVRDPDIRYANSGTTTARFTVAVDRRYKKEGEDSADFISCVAFGKTAELIEKYFFKGTKIGITGRIQTGSYTNKDGQKIYTTDVVLESAEFVESKASNERANTPPQTTDSDFMSIPDISDDELPFK